MRTDLYVTGTDTNVGKTYVTVQLLRELAAAQRVVGMKPVASGSERIDGVLRNADALQLMQASNVDADYATVNPYAFAPAIAPEYAARDAGVEIEVSVIRQTFDTLTQRSDLVLVEGAGGWLSPVTETIDQADVARALGIRDVLLVVGMGLGCVHRARATARAIEADGFRLKGWIANEAGGDDPDLNNNLQAIERNLGAAAYRYFRYEPI